MILFIGYNKDSCQFHLQGDKLCFELYKNKITKISKTKEGLVYKLHVVYKYNERRKNKIKECSGVVHGGAELVTASLFGALLDDL